MEATSLTAARASVPALLSRLGKWLDARGRWQRRLLAASAGAVATLGHAPFQLTMLYVAAIVALVWLLDAAHRKRARLLSAFEMGWWFGFGHMTTGLYWVSSAFNVDSVAWGPLWGVPATALLGIATATFFGVGCTLAMTLWTRDVRRIFAFAAALLVTEWLRGNAVFGGFPWLLPGYVWTPGEPVSQLASVVGIYGLSLLTLLIAATPAALADPAASTVRRLAPTLIAALVVGLGFGWGARRLAETSVVAPPPTPVVRVADSGLGQAAKWEARADQEWRVLARYLEASGAPYADSNANILVWPEGAIPTINFFVLENPEFLEALGRGLGDRALITGLSRRDRAGDRLAYFNSAAVIDGVGGALRVGQIYDKNRLVPFSEYIPFWSLIGPFNIAPLQRIGAGFDQGAPPSRVIIPDAPPAVVLICYEAIFPGMVPRGDERPGWIVSVTNDAWFGRGTGPWQHYAMARYRAIEEGLPMARAASGGVSAIIDPLGREVVSTDGERLSVEAPLPASLPETTFARFGNILLLVLLLITAAGRFSPRNRKLGEASA
ncbi:MAG: apolipoprotein N-acyltransferase [Hyphomonadaceae bacterium]|nr:apolipoprotein N-acyltransferase [Hyphomonadaceae bacterium]